jgi:hypothetical protein
VKEKSHAIILALLNALLVKQHAPHVLQKWIKNLMLVATLKKYIVISL